MLDGKRIAVVLPAYEAARTLTVVVNELGRVSVVDDVVLVDDASPDGTAELAESLGLFTVRHEQNGGYGANQKTCYRVALERGADVVVMLHPDHQYSTKLVTSMAAMVASEEYDLVLASRITAQHNALSGGMPRYKFVANRALTAIENVLLQLKMSEYHSGYRAFSRRLLATLPLELNSNDFVFDNQIIAQARWAGFRIGEISCPTRYDEESHSIGLKRAMTYGWGVLATAGRYRMATWGWWVPPYLAHIPTRAGGAVAPAESAAVGD